MRKKEKTIGLKVPQPLADKLEDIARRGKTSKSAILNAMIKAFISMKNRSTLSPQLRRLTAILERNKGEGLYRNEEGKKVAVVTKLEEPYLLQLEEIVKREKTNKNVLLFGLLSSVVNCTDGDGEGETNKEIEREIKAFKKRVSLFASKARRKAAPAERCEMAIYFLRDKEGKLYAVHVAEPLQKGKRLRVTYSAQRILKRVLEVCLPSVVRRLKAIEGQTNTNNYIETIAALLESEEDKAEAEYIESLFAENDKDEYGHNLTPIKYKPNNTKSPFVERWLK